MRRGLGFKLREAGKGLIDFVTFLEQQSASYIAQELVLARAPTTLNVQPAQWARRLSFVRGFALWSLVFQRVRLLTLLFSCSAPVLRARGG